MNYALTYVICACWFLTVFTRSVALAVRAALAAISWVWDRTRPGNMYVMLFSCCVMGEGGGGQDGGCAEEGGEQSEG